MLEPVFGKLACDVPSVEETMAAATMQMNPNAAIVPTQATAALVVTGLDDGTSESDLDTEESAVDS